MIFISSDHGGFRLKEEIIKWLNQKKLKFQDVGPKVLQQDDDYPDFAFSLAKKVVRGKDNLGILIGRSGIGMTVAANKIKKVKAGLCSFVSQAITARAHNGCNILILPADFIDTERAIKIVKSFLQAGFSPEERNIRRLKRIEEIENN